MPEMLNLNDPASVLARRELLVATLPEVLQVAGAHDQLGQLGRGQNDEVVDWFRGYVSVGAHGANAGEFGLTEDQTRDFNPVAQKVGLMAPTRLWTPGDDLPQGAKVGDIVNYSVTPEWGQLSLEVFRSQETVAIDATVDGTIGRLDAGLGAAVRSNVAQIPNGRGRLAVMTGLRAVKPGEGASGLYKQFLPDGTDPETPIDVAFPTATDATIAILAKRCSTKFELIYEVEDPEAGRKPADRTHPKVAPEGRTWIARYYEAIDDATGKEVLITVVNGEPIAPTGDELNRSRSEPAPRAADTFMDYLRLPLTYLGEQKNLAISYAHLGRIGAELLARVQREAPGQLGGVALLGSMPQPGTWNRIINGKHNGGTLGAKEYYPFLRALNGLLGLDPRDIARS